MQHNGCETVVHAEVGIGRQCEALGLIFYDAHHVIMVRRLPDSVAWLAAATADKADQAD